MIIVRLLGGLGNQMFQFAFARSLSISLNTCVKIDLSLLEASRHSPEFTPRNFDLDIFDVQLEFLEHKDLCENESIYSIAERSFEYDDDLLDYISTLEGSYLVSGYWQSHKYFDKYRTVITRDFQFKNPLLGKWDLLKRDIRSSESVMINVRRTDYLEKIDYHGVVTIEYLSAAMEMIKSKITCPRFFVFSDDMNWCRAHIAGENIFFVDESYYDAKYQYYLQLMSGCKHFILANSSFAWWSAYLASPGGIVIAPKNWFRAQIDTRDLTPPTWLRI